MTNTSRTVIIGGPNTGKTTLAGVLKFEHKDDSPALLDLHTDDTKDMEWSKASEMVVPWFDKTGPWVLEGVAAVRALRKWLSSHKEGKPCDELIFLTKPQAAQNKGQAAMAKGVGTVFAEIEAEMVKRGVTITREFPTDIAPDTLKTVIEALTKESRVDAAPAAEEAITQSADPTSSALEAAGFVSGGKFDVSDSGRDKVSTEGMTAGPLVSFAKDPANTIATRDPQPGDAPLSDTKLDAGQVTSDAKVTPIAPAAPAPIDPAAYERELDIIHEQITALSAKDPATLSVHDRQDLDNGKARMIELTEALAEHHGRQPVTGPADTTRGDKRAKQWWKDRPWKDGPNGATSPATRPAAAPAGGHTHTVKK